jgi:uncharacterized protein YcfL
MKRLLVSLSLVLLAACGAQQQRTYGIEEETQLVLRSEQLVGAIVTVAPTFKRSITEDDLTPYQMGIGGVKDKEVQNLQTITVKVTPGTHRVTVERNGIPVLDQDLYFGQGQTRELRIR